jgi:hypothetical protein
MKARWATRDRRPTARRLLGHQDGVNGMDHAVIGRHIGAYYLGIVHRSAPMVLTITSLPCTVLTLPGFRSLDMTLPDTTW